MCLADAPVVPYDTYIRLRNYGKDTPLRSVQVSEEVYEVIAENGKFGESVDDVLRRLLGVPDGPAQSKPFTVTPRRRASRTRPRLSERTLSSRVEGGQLLLAVEGEEISWDLPARHEIERIRTITYEALDWAEERGATIGQLKAVRKALSEAGYFIGKPRRLRPLPT
jgi:hypothetical protein